VNTSNTIKKIQIKVENFRFQHNYSETLIIPPKLEQKERKKETYCEKYYLSQNSNLGSLNFRKLISLNELDKFLTFLLSILI